MAEDNSIPLSLQVTLAWALNIHGNRASVTCWYGWAEPEAQLYSIAA